MPEPATDGLHGTVVQVSLSPGGVPNLPVPAARVGDLGLAGDGHDDAANHGGPERAVCLWALERIEALAAEGHPIFAGAAGENLTTRGVDWDSVVPGVRIRAGEVLLEVTRYTTPCKTNARWFLGGDFNVMHQNVRPGWSRVYARVLEPGIVRTGDPVEVLASAAIPA